MDTWYNLIRKGLFGTNRISTHVIEMPDRNNHMVGPHKWHISRQNAPRQKEIIHDREVALRSPRVVVCGFADQILLRGVNNRVGPAFTTDFETKAKGTKAVELTPVAQNLFNSRSPTVLLVANGTRRPTISWGGNVYDAPLITFRRTSMRHFITAGLLASLAAAASAQVVKYPTAPPGRILQGVSIGAKSEMLFLSGQLASPLDPSKPMTAATMTMADFGDTKTQTISTLGKIKAALGSHGYTMADIVKMTVFVAGDPAHDGKMDFAGMNEGFAQFFNTADNPTTVARSAFQVAALAAPAFLVEIEVVAAK